jgi:hypothetical protein
MPLDGKGRAPVSRGRRRTGTPRLRLAMPVIGMESEFNVLLDGVEIDPRKYWGHPMAFIEGSLLPREKSSFHLPTGGAVYFDRGVIEVVTPVIEIAPGSTARVVRNLWECIGFVRDELTKWEGRTGHEVKLKGYSAHYNVSFELPVAEQAPDRNIKAMAKLLAYILPLPVALAGTNRRSTGVGVRPRGNRIEVTVDFTPDPALMIATATLIVGIVREMMTWPSYRLALLDELPIPTVDGVIPGKHTTRKGWLTKDFQYAQSPYTTDPDAVVWKVRDGRTLSLRRIAQEVAFYFRRSIRRHSDPFSFRLLFAVLDGRLRSLLELPDRPLAFEDVGRLCKWGSVLPDLTQRGRSGGADPGAKVVDLERYVSERQGEREQYVASLRAPMARRRSVGKPKPPEAAEPSSPGPAAAATPEAPRAPARPRRSTRPGNGRQAGRIADTTRVSWSPEETPYVERRTPPKPVERRLGQRRRGAATPSERRRANRRERLQPIPFPDRRLSRSAYEKVFLKLVSGGRLRIGRQTWTPVGMKGWYHAIFRNDTDGRERLITIDQLLKKMTDWET